jgi:hypothetical protein
MKTAASKKSTDTFRNKNNLHKNILALINAKENLITAR